MARWSIHVMAVLVLAAASALAQDETETPFEAALRAVRTRANEGAATAEKLEEEYLAMLTPDVSREDRGRLYTCVVDLLDSARRPEGVEVYCREALRYPLAPEEASRMYARWASAAAGRFRDWQGERWRVARHMIGEPLFAGLRFVLDHGAPAARIPPPGVGKYSIPDPPPEVLAEHRRQLEERERVDALNDLWLSRQGMSELLVYIYSLPPADPDEMKALLDKTLGDYPEAVAGLMAALDVELRRGQDAK